MSAPTAYDFSRRDFLRASVIAGTGLTIGFALTGCAPDDAGKSAAASAALIAPNPFVRVNGDGSVVVISKHTEMGQGAYTGLATLVAEELDADWTQVTVESAPADAKRYGNTAWGGAMGTGGSSAIANSWEQYRVAGATARALLVNAAAAEWGTNASALVTEQGRVKDPASGKSFGYGELVAKAATLPVPANVKPKAPGQWKLIGKEGTTPRLDRVAKTTGTATFTQDFTLPGMLVAVVAHPPRFGATLASVDDAKALAVPGVKQVVKISQGVAVVAEHFWAAKQGRAALQLVWDESKAFTKSNAELTAEYRNMAAKPGPVAKNVGDARGALAKGAKVVEARYEVPFLPHAAMEPMNCVVKISADKCEIWTGAQSQSSDQGFVAKLLNLPPEKVEITMLLAGGSFGRRANPLGDFVLEAAEIAKGVGVGVPVKMVWTREDDMRAGYYRPAVLHDLQASLGADGMPTAWYGRTVAQSLFEGTPFEPMMVKDGVDMASLEGATDLPYTVANHRLELHAPKLPVPVQWWRSVGHTHTAFADECFIDECAHAAGQDPVQYRLALLGAAPRHAGALKLVAEKAGWGTPMPAGRARGVAVHKSFDSYVAQVAEVSMEGGKLKVHRVVAAVDCGVVVNPDVVRAQVEGAVAYGLSAALYGRITFDKGAVVEGNFDKYRPLRFAEMPVVEVHIVPSTESPTGIGEPGLPPLAPAIANAVFALNGTRLRTMPFVNA